MLGNPSHQITTIDEIKRWYLQFRINRIVRYFNNDLDVTLTKVTLDEDKKSFVLEFVKSSTSFLILTISNIHKLKWQYEWNISTPGIRSQVKSESYKDFSKTILKIL